jgi:nucleoside-diphosphate-sugar epimerase
MRVVILGARGFVARALGDRLHNTAFGVRAISRDEVDLLAPTAVDALSTLLRPDDTVVMPAALTPDKGRDVATLMKNLRMAETLCSTLATTTCSHVIYVSSDAVYPTSPDPITEETMSVATDLYSLMHIARERMFGHLAAEKHIPYCVLRPSAIYGAEDTHNSYGPNRFIRTAMASHTIRLFGAGEEERDHVYIDDVATVIRLAVERRTTGTLNVVTGRAVSFRQVAETVQKHVGGTVTIETAPRSGPITHRHFDVRKLRRTFPELQITSLEQGIERTVAVLMASAV